MLSLSICHKNTCSKLRGSVETELWDGGDRFSSPACVFYPSPIWSFIHPLTLLLKTHTQTHPCSHLSSLFPHIFIHLCIPPVIIRPASIPPTLHSLLPQSLGIHPSPFIYTPHPPTPPSSLHSGPESSSSLAAEKSLETSSALPRPRS